MLQAKGYAVQAVESAVDGLKLLVEGGIDLVIVDVKMPGMDGYDTYEEIRHNPSMHDVPILFLTAFQDAFSLDKEPAFKAWRDHFKEGTTDILYKPTAVDGLAAKVESLIGPAGGNVGIVFATPGNRVKAAMERVLRRR